MSPLVAAATAVPSLSPSDLWYALRRTIAGGHGVPTEERRLTHHGKKFITHTGVGVPLRRSNIDTDRSSPPDLRERVTRTGFEDARYLRRVEERPTSSSNQDMVQLRPAGPGSAPAPSREHAVWALKRFWLPRCLAPSS